MVPQALLNIPSRHPKKRMVTSSRQAVHSDLGCQTLGHSEPVPKPWLRCASGAAIGEDTASFSAKGFPAETFVCYKKVRDGEALRWKSCLEFSIKPEDVAHDYASCGGLDHSPQDEDNIKSVGPSDAGQGETLGFIQCCNPTAIDSQSTLDVFQVQDADQEVRLAQICPSVPEGSFDSPGKPATCIDETKNDTAPTISPTCIWSQPCVEAKVELDPPYVMPDSVPLPGREELRVPETALLAAFRDSIG